MNVPESDILIIGAGPAGIACALTLTKHDYTGSIRIVECGRDYTERFCSLDKREQCTGCGGICNVISGFGGCTYYGRAVKLSGFPSGHRLLKILGEERAYVSMQEAINLFVSEGSTNFCLPCSDNIPFSMKTYPVLCLNSERVRSTIRRFRGILVGNDRITLHLSTRAIAIERHNRGFDVICTCGSKSNGEIVFRTKNVVVAVGRKGLLWWRQELRRLGLIHKPAVSSLGLRFECPRQYLIQAARLHLDFKATIYESRMKFKTFCFCAGSGGGCIRFTDYGSFTLLDGHVVPEADRAIQVANFALLVQLRDKDGNPRSFEWIKENILTPYQRLNIERPGKPVLQWYPDFKNRALSCNSFTDFVRLTGWSPSVYDVGFANLASLLPDLVHEAFCNVFERLFTWFCELSRNVKDRSTIDNSLAQVGVMGLELEGLWEEVQVDSFMQSSINGIFVAGDCAGIAQGVLQAMVSGIEVAHHCLENGKKRSLNQ